MTRVLYEDNHVLVIEKPPGIPAMPDISGDRSMLEIAKEYIKTKYGKPGNVFIGLIHRLDRSTGGVMVFARTSKGASRLSKQIRDHGFQKTYLAVVEGILSRKEGSLKNYLLKDERSNKSRVVGKTAPGAREAVLSYRVLSEKEGFSLISIDLETGRHHQIRVQFSNLGHPVYGDKKYGSKKGGGQALWSNKIIFRQPVTGESISIESNPDYCTEPWSLFS